MATFADLSAENPNLRQQYDDRRQLRSQNGEDPTDYQAFRQHVINRAGGSARTTQQPTAQRVGHRRRGEAGQGGLGQWVAPAAAPAQEPAEQAWLLLVDLSRRLGQVARVLVLVHRHALTKPRQALLSGLLLEILPELQALLRRQARVGLLGRGLVLLG